MALLDFIAQLEHRGGLALLPGNARAVDSADCRARRHMLEQLPWNFEAVAHGHHIRIADGIELHQLPKRVRALQVA